MKMKVVVRNWTLEKFTAAVYRVAAKQELAKRHVKMTVVRECYDGMFTVRACVAKMARNAAKAERVAKAAPAADVALAA